MPSKCRKSEASYNSGCRCSDCKSAAAEGRRDRRRREREAVGEFVQVVPKLSIVSGGAATSANAPDPNGTPAADTVEAGVLLEIECLEDHPRPGLEAAALALARVLDNPKAVSTQPAAAANWPNF